MGKLQAEHLIKCDDGFKKTYNLCLLKPELRLILNLLIHEEMSIKEAISISGMSYRGFYLMLEKVHELGIVDFTTDATDRRVRRIALTNKEKIRALLDVRANAELMAQ